MGFTEAVKSVFSKYATFSGRATRSEYWYFTLFNIIVSVVLGTLSSNVSGPFDDLDRLMTNLIYSQGLQWIWSLITLIPGLAVSVRRLHDTNRSGWNILWLLLPLIGPIILIVFYCKASGPENQYGEVPA